MIYQSEAIVLNHHKYGNTSLICNLFTEKYGKVNIISKGARRFKNPNSAINKTIVVPKVFIARIRSNSVGPSVARSSRKNITTKMAMVAVINIRFYLLILAGTRRVGFES